MQFDTACQNIVNKSRVLTPNKTKAQMKRITSVLIFLLTSVIIVFSQNKKIDYTTYDIVAKRNRVAVVVKDNDWRMIVGNLTKPKRVFFLGNAKDQANSRISSIILMGENDFYIKKNRHVNFCGIPFLLDVDDEILLFKDHNYRKFFLLTLADCEFFRESILEYSFNR